MKPEKRHDLKFQDFDEALADIDSLLASGYEETGNWDLGQVCNHLAQGIELTLGAPRMLMRGMIFLFFNLLFIGRIGGALGLRVPTSVPQNQPIDDSVGREEFHRQLAKLLATEDASLIRFNLWHAQHHLGFLVPKR